MIDILGIGTIFAGGRGVQRFEDALINSRTFAAPDDKGRYAYQVPPDALKDPALKGIRRADKLSKMAVLAASEAAGSLIDPINTGVIVSTALGAHVTTFEFLDDILDYGDVGVSPTTFSNSVHNAAASYISSVLGIQGPTMTITEFAFSLHHALVLAGLWIAEGRCKHVLVGGVEQYGDALGHIAGRMLTPSSDGLMAPFGFRDTRCVPGEGAVFFLVGPEGSGDAIARINSVGFDASAPTEDLLVIDTDGMLPDESGYLAALSGPAASYSPVFGSSMSCSAFHLAASALMLRCGAGFPNPVKDNPTGIRLFDPLAALPLKSIRCLRLDCAGSRGWISLAKPL